MKTEIAPLLIITKLEQYDYAGATAIAVVMLVVSFVLLLAINLLQCVERAAGDGARHGRHAPPAAPPTRRARHASPRWVRWLLIARRARRSSALFLVLPLVAVFAEALAEGLGGLLRARSSSPTRSRRSG